MSWPGAGLAVAEMVTGGKPVIDLAPFRYGRLHDGTRLRPGGKF